MNIRVSLALFAYQYDDMTGVWKAFELKNEFEMTKKNLILLQLSFLSRFLKTLVMFAQEEMHQERDSLAQKKKKKKSVDDSSVWNSFLLTVLTKHVMILNAKTLNFFKKF